MHPRNRLLLVVAALAAVALIGLGTRPMVQAQSEVEYDTDNYEQTLDQLVETVTLLRRTRTVDMDLLRAIQSSDDPLYIAPLLDIGYFVRGTNPVADAIYRSLADLTGEDFGNDWRAYFEYAGRENIEVPPGYAEFKGELFSVLIDPRFNEFFEEGVQDTAVVNMTEVVWGGVTVDGIPSLVNAPQISPEDATDLGEDLTRFCRNTPDGDRDCSYPAPDELVFGVYINGDARAYPLRQLNWHEMFNDVIGSTALYAEPDATTDPVCNFRAPTVFSVAGRHGDELILIGRGESAGCPTEGWVAQEDLQWLDEDTGNTVLTWDEVRDDLPNLSAGEEPLPGGQRLNARVDGMPVMLAYCTLCGSGVLYDATVPDLTYETLEGETVELGDTVLEFGSTGMLMRSNKLMYDRNTNTVWNALTGEPAFGPLVSADVQLDILPVVISDWATWQAEHPDTSVLTLRTGFARDYTNGAAYSDYFNDPNFIMFPVWQQDTTDQEAKEMVYGLFVEGIRKAYPLAAIVPEQVTNDTIGETDVVLVTRATPEREFFEPGGAAVRAYRSEGIEFSPTDDPLVVEDADGNAWQVTENALIGPDDQELRRLGGHLAFWFGWYAYFPETEVYMPAA